mgnify:CR=1 FL=1
MAKFVSFIPFVYSWYLRVLAGSPKTVLDMGCGDGTLMEGIAGNNWKITGIDIYEKDILNAKKKGIYEKLIKGDLVRETKRLVKQEKKYDLVFCSQVIEHITKKEGRKLLDLAEKLTKKRIYFGTPRGFMRQPEVFLKGNPYQYHKSGWSIEDFTSRGYRVYGIGFNPVWSEKGPGRSKNIFIFLVASLVSYVLTPLVFFVPSLASGIMAVKDK